LRKSTPNIWPEKCMLRRVTATMHVARVAII
jgi:hypothetical protein